MSEQKDLSSSTDAQTDSVSVTESIVKMLEDQTKQPVTCLPMHKNEVPFARDLKNPSNMSRVTYGCLTALLLDNTTRALVGLPLLDISPIQRAEIKRVMREAPLIHINGVGMVKKRTDDERRRPVNGPKPKGPRANAQPEVGDDQPRANKVKNRHPDTDSTTYQIIGHIHREMRNHPEEKPRLKMHENSLRNRDQMTPETLDFLEVLHQDLVKSSTHSLRTEYVKESIAEILNKSRSSQNYIDWQGDAAVPTDREGLAEEAVAANEDLVRAEDTPEQSSTPAEERPSSAEE